MISIHALLAESDWTAPCSPADCGYFYPRSPCGERRYTNNIVRVVRGISIHALLAESDGLTMETLKSIIISIHALLAESDFPHNYPHGRGYISIHALLAESDRACPLWTTALPKFLSTLSLRRATVTRQQCCADQAISIHALLAESDPQGCSLLS